MTYTNKDGVCFPFFTYPCLSARDLLTIGVGIHFLKYSSLSSPLLLVGRERLNFDEHSTMGRQPMKDVLAEYVSFQISVLMKDLAFRDLMIKD